MPPIKQRQTLRVDSLNLTFYCIDEEGNITAQGMGRTLNISKEGILLEINTKLQPEQTIDVEIALGNNIIDARGTVIYSTRQKDESFQTGIQFTKISDTDQKILNAFI